FSAITTDRIRMTLPASQAEPLEITSIQIYGPEQTLPGDLSPRWSASYIWYPEPGRIYKAGSPYYFRKTFEIKDTDTLHSASIQARSNDHYTISINGKSVYQTSAARTGKAIPVAPYLRPGKNVIAIETNLNSTP